MSRILGLIVLTASISFAGNAFVGAQIFIEDFGVDTNSEPQGVYCEINGVKLMAKTPADCEKAGGTITHVISTTVTPVGEAMDNPEEEPEIQREKDKEPEAP